MDAGASSSGGCRTGASTQDRSEHYARAFSRDQFVSSRPGLNPNSPAFRYIWRGLQFPIMLPPAVQLPESCSFAAVARQVEYDLRIRYAKESQEFNVGFNHQGWEAKVRLRFKNVAIWDPFNLMELILHEMMPGPVDHNTKRVGLLVSGSEMSHYSNIIYQQNQPSAELITRWLTHYRMPLVAIVPVMSSYPSTSHEPYTNTNNVPMDQLLAEPQSHAIVLVGVYDHSKDNNPLNLDRSRTYFIFQSSFNEETVDALAERRAWSLLPCGMSVVDSTLIMYVCGTTNFPQPAVVHRKVKQVMPRDWTGAEDLKSMIKHYEQLAIREHEGRKAIRGLQIPDN